MSELHSDATPTDTEAMAAALAGTFSEFLGLGMGPEADDGSVTAELDLRPDMCQPMGIVHGGILSAVAEELASYATFRHVCTDGRFCVGQSNLTHFLRPTRSGTLHVKATPLHRGRTSWVWQVVTLDDAGRRCAVSTVTMAVRRPE